MTIRDVVELNRAVLDVGRRLALIDTGACASLLRIQPDEADALANMPDITLEHFAQAGISVLVMEPAQPLGTLPLDSSAALQDLEKQLERIFEAVHAAAHRCAIESTTLCQTYFRAEPSEAKRLTTLTELGRRTGTNGCVLKIHGLSQIVELINRERGMPQFITRLDSALLASRLATLPL